MDIKVVGKIVKQTRNCACGTVEEGYCDFCKTLAEDVVILTALESVKRGMYDFENDSFQVEEAAVWK